MGMMEMRLQNITLKQIIVLILNDSIKLVDKLIK